MHYLQVNAVELIKAGPCSTRRQALEELPHSDVVQRVRAIEDHTLSMTDKTRLIRKILKADRIIIAENRAHQNVHKADTVKPRGTNQDNGLDD
jgi:uncharacterized iron-regulated protein